MSTYTTQVRFICENYAGLSESVGELSTRDVINRAYPLIFDEDIEIYNPETKTITTDSIYKGVLFPKILSHFYTREISFETVGLWKFHLNNRLREIMPYFNQLYASEALEFEPLINVDITEKHDQEGTDDKTVTGKRVEKDVQNVESTETTNSTSNGDRQSSVSDTPQGALNGVMSNTYLSAGQHDVTTDSNNSRDEFNSERNTINNIDASDVTDDDTTLKYTHAKRGKEGSVSYSELLNKYRDTFLNIDEQIINRLNDLFFGLW